MIQPPRVGWVGSSQVARLRLLPELFTCPLDLPPENLLNVLDVKDLRSFMRARILGVLVITREVRFGAPPFALSVGGPLGEMWSQGNPRSFCPHIPCGLRLSEDLNLSDELILTRMVASSSEQPSRVHEPPPPVAHWIILEAREHLKELPFGGELGFLPVGPYLRRNSRKKVSSPTSSMWTSKWGGWTSIGFESPTTIDLLLEAAANWNELFLGRAISFSETFWGRV